MGGGWHEDIRLIREAAAKRCQADPARCSGPTNDPAGTFLAGLTAVAYGGPLIIGIVEAASPALLSVKGWALLNPLEARAVGILGIEAVVGIDSGQSTSIPAARVAANRLAGNAFRDLIADLLEKEGREVAKEVHKWTPFGKRFIDIEVGMNGTILGGIETKAGGSRYTTGQRIKDWWLRTFEGYTVVVVREQ